MAYQNIAYEKSKNLLHIWDDQKGYFTMPYKKYAYRKNNNGKYVALDGNRVEKIYEWDDTDLQRGVIYESDIGPETRTLVDLYYESDDVSTGHREMYLDIEVGTEGGFSDTEEVWQPLTSISFYDRAADQYVAILVDPAGKVTPKVSSNLILESVKTEKELMHKFLTHYASVAPTIITGWNIEFFDIPYLYNRIQKVLGTKVADKLSPINDVIWLKHRNRYKLQGVACLDYMALYKNFTYSEESSYSLEAISQKELGKGKIQYDGTLDHLYQTDIDKFIEYNINDVRLVYELDLKLQFLDQARGVCHKGHVSYDDIYFTTRYLDGACLSYMKRLGIVAPNRKNRVANSVDVNGDTHSNDFAGAYVMDPVPGVYKWIFDEDMASLYPSIIRTLNISPETKIGRVENWDIIQGAFIANQDNGFKVKLRCGIKQSSFDITEFRKYLLDNKYTISAIGVIYDSQKPGIIPSILETWMAEREEFRAMAKKYGKEGNTELARFFDAKQLTAKILNNSLYGGLGSPGFRFHDLDNAESITLTGQSVIKHAMSKGNEWFIKQTGEEKQYVIYVDTDSNYFSADPIITLMEKKLGKELSREEKIDITYKTSQVVEKFINDSFTSYAKHVLNSDNHFLTIKQEYVSESGIWIAKKRYAQKIITEKGVLISELTQGKKHWKLDVKGMDVIRSNFPKAFREFMSGILIDILNLVDRQIIDDKVLAFRDDIKIKPMIDIMFPTGVKELTKYQIKKDPGQMFADRVKATPAHAKAALVYNDLLDYFKIKGVQPIGNGEKIKWTYLKSNVYGIDGIALKGFEDPKEIVSIIEKYIDYDRIFKASLENKLQDFYNALGYGKVPANDTLTNFFSF